MLWSLDVDRHVGVCRAPLRFRGRGPRLTVRACAPSGWASSRLRGSSVSSCRPDLCRVFELLVDGPAGGCSHVGVFLLGGLVAELAPLRSFRRDLC